MKKAIFFISILVLSKFGISQIISSTNFVQGNISDGEKLTKAYLSSLEHAIAFANGDGNINFTKSEKQFKFYFGVNLSVVGTLGKDRTYDVNSLNLEEIESSNPNSTIAQTYFGDESYIELQSTTNYRVPEFPFGYTEKPLFKFNTPKGSGGMLNLPSMNLGVFAYGTHLTVNALAKINIPETNGDIYSLGFSIQHNLGEFIKPISDLPVNISILIAYQKTKLNYYLDIKPDETRTELNLSDSNGPYDKQVLILNTKAVPFDIIISKEINDLNIYGFLGYTLQSSTVELKGNYPLYVADPLDLFKINVEDITDPFAYENNFNELKLGLGASYQIGVIKFKTNTSFSRYFLFNFGFELVL